MLTSILKQILNQRRSNAWIVAELMLVFCLVWYIADYLFVYTYNLNIPGHSDLRHAWQITLGEYPPNYSRYSDAESTDEAREANFERILRLLRDAPGIEAIAVLSARSGPASIVYMGSSLQSADDSTLFVPGQQVEVDPRDDFFRVFAHTTDGGRAASSRDFGLDDPRRIVITRSVAGRLFPDGSPAVGRTVLYRREPYTVAGVIDDVKRFDYLRPQSTFYIFSDRHRAARLPDAAIAVRSHPSAGKAFGEMFKADMTARLQVGNFYLRSIVAYTGVAEETAELFGISKDVRVRTYLMAFFLLNVLLCVTGTFRYRVNMRREEIGTRRALGASSSGVRNALLLEGLCLLTVAMLPAVAIEFHFVHAGLIDTLGKNANETGLYLPDRTYLRFLITNAITWAVMAAVIIAAIWLPARRAAALTPAEALHYE
ncbi:MAG: ABC transporter permease [Tannerella sp.]|jgi:hypothetical protein|nr:ABC transporter permease [Tannerella sp.]